MTALVQGDVIIVNYSPSIGHEPAERPALVVTDRSFNTRSSLVGVLPITSTDNGYPLHVPIHCGEIEGFACVEQLRNIDLASRGHKLIGAASEETMRHVMGLIFGMFGQG